MQNLSELNLTTVNSSVFECVEGRGIGQAGFEGLFSEDTENKLTGKIRYPVYYIPLKIP